MLQQLLRALSLYELPPLVCQEWLLVLQCERSRTYSNFASAYRRALETATKAHVPSYLLPEAEIRLDLVVAMAVSASCTDPSLAVELAALAHSHPSSTGETKRTTQRLLDGLESKLSPDSFAAAKARGRARDLCDTVEELLQQLGPEADSE